MSRRRVVSLVAVALPAIGFLLACACAPPMPVSSVQSSAAPVASSPSVAASASAADTSVAATAPMPSVPTAQAPSAEAPPPCIGGEIMMGACICAKGKSADATGHCVFMTTCPKSASGGTVFRDDATGECRVCRPGTRPMPDGSCGR